MGCAFMCGYPFSRTRPQPIALAAPVAREMGFHAVFIGTGAGYPSFMGIPGESLNGVLSANELPDHLPRLLGDAQSNPETARYNPVLLLRAGNNFAGIHVDEMVGKLKVVSMLESMPGVGKVRARRLMEELDISESRRLRAGGRRD